MQKILQKIQKVFAWIAKQIAEEIVTGLREELRAQIAEVNRTIAERHKTDPIAEECDLAMLDDRICSLIAKCDAKGYTTNEDRRRVSRMHDAYKERGGNHGEENEYARFLRLPTEEEHKRHEKENAYGERD